MKVSEIVEIFDSGLRDEDRITKLEEENQKLLTAVSILWSASLQGHSAHWDPTGGSGSGCPACQRAWQLRDKAVEVLGFKPDQYIEED